ncbi:hypothetical protein L227DRAFT_653789 [Lentinus tigrinus ALCF2SS1-6]|uniref:F-box domain-containing protein n=1 Tax=Lentinus tigrinus ALCF2SS1-6 TaxID=1328759 RepID=A0A5C2S7R9_9APHY|nr:hypothetical protein L227DRAFT_653789 [Lentinus tigrinus ALCF2SS1-6]
MPHLAPVPALPVELHLAILELLRGDRLSLLACCLTCKLWSTHCQPLLYRAVRITPRNAISFCNTLTARPELASRVVQLTLENMSNRDPPPDIFRKLTNIKHLYLAAGSQGLMNFWANAVMSVNRSSIEQFTLQDCFLDAGTFRRFWSQTNFPKLQALHVLNCPVLDRRYVRRGRPRRDPAIQPKVAMLSLRAPVPSTFLAGRAAGSSASSQPHRSLSVLKLRLDCGPGRCTTMVTFRQFFNDVGPNLRDLDIGFSRVEGPFVGQDVWQRGGMPFDHCVNLRRLTLEHSVMEPDRKRCLGHLDHAPMLLGTLRAPELRYIKLVVRQSYKVKENGPQTWGRIAQVLAGARFASVHGVRVCLADGQGNKNVFSWVKKQLRALDGRRPVDVVLVDNPRVRTGTAQGPRASRQIQERPTRLG